MADHALFGLLTQAGYNVGVFGKVTKGLDVVKAMNVLGASNGKPQKVVRIEDSGQIA